MVIYYDLFMRLKQDLNWSLEAQSLNTHFNKPAIDEWMGGEGSGGGGWLRKAITITGAQHQVSEGESDLHSHRMTETVEGRWRNSHKTLKIFQNRTS